MELYRQDGWTVQVVEKWNPFARVRQDLLGIIDILCVCKFRGILGLQVTTQGKAPEHLRKIQDEPRSQVWLQAGGKLHIVEWKTVQAKRNKAWFYRTYVFPYAQGASKVPEWRQA
jgi:hypothetical protein